VQRVQVGFRDVEAAARGPAADGRLRGRRRTDGRIVLECERVALSGRLEVLVLACPVPRIVRLRVHGAQDCAGVGTHVVDHRLHAAGRVGEKVDVRLGQNLRGGHLLGQRGLLAGLQGQVDDVRVDPVRGVRRGGWYESEKGGDRHDRSPVDAVL
jgi:hypothetical protein